MDILHDNDFDEDLDKNNNNQDCCLERSITEQLKSSGAQDANEFINHLGQYSLNTVSEIEILTKGQTENLMWKKMRHGMVTASNFKKVCDAVDKNQCFPSLIKTLLSKYADKNDVPALQWGRKKESTARDLYVRVARRIHKKAKIEEQGLYIMQEYPFIGCSVDGIFLCQCHNKKLIEIKCPYATRTLHPKEVSSLKGCNITGSQSVVTRDSEYYHQMQGQMGIYGINQSELIIYTQKGIHVSTLEFDKQFFDNMVMKLKTFFKDIFFQHLREDRLE